LHALKKYDEVLEKLEELQEITKVHFGTQSEQVSASSEVTADSLRIYASKSATSAIYWL
jgi:hypothetical protein